jgi:hypothetical protein
MALIKLDNKNEDLADAFDIKPNVRKNMIFHEVFEVYVCIQQLYLEPSQEINLERNEVLRRGGWEI